MASSLKHQKGVKYEKKPNAMAMARIMFQFQFQIQTKRKLETIFQLFNVFAALFLFSRSYSSLFPIALSYYRTLLFPLFSDPFYVFLLLNSIILFLYALSNNHTAAHSKDLYDEFLSNSSNTTARVASPKNIPDDAQTVTALDSSSENKKSVIRSEVVEESPHSPVLNGTVTEVTTTHETTTTCCTATFGHKVSEKKCYRRVRSDSFEVVARSGGPELRRMSTSGLRRHGRLCHVEQLNKDEFNRAVEDFIAKQKRMLWEEQNQPHKAENLAF